MREEPDCVKRIYREQNPRCSRYLVNAERGDRREPYEHHRSENPSDFCRALFLYEKQAKQNCEGEWHDSDMKFGGDDLEPFHCAQNRYRRSYDSIAVEQRCSDQSERYDDLLEISIYVASSLLEKEREQCENSTLTAIVRAQDEDQILHADDEYECPDDEREHSVYVRRGCGEAVLRLEAGLEGVERTGPDVAEYDTECDERKLSEPLPRGMRLWMFRDWVVLSKTFAAVQKSSGPMLQLQ